MNNTTTPTLLCETHLKNKVATVEPLQGAEKLARSVCIFHHTPHRAEKCWQFMETAVKELEQADNFGFFTLASTYSSLGLDYVM